MFFYISISIYARWIRVTNQIQRSKNCITLFFDVENNEIMSKFDKKTLALFEMLKIFLISRLYYIVILNITQFFKKNTNNKWNISIIHIIKKFWLSKSFEKSTSMFLSKRVINVHNIFEFCIRVYCAFVLNSRIYSFNRFTRDFSLLTKLVFLFKLTKFLNIITFEFVISLRNILKTTLLTTIFWRLTFFLTRKKNIIFFIFFLVDFNQINFIQKTIINYLLTHQLNEISFHKIEFYLFYNRCNNVNRFFEFRCDIE